MEGVLPIFAKGKADLARGVDGRSPSVQRRVPLFQGTKNHLSEITGRWYVKKMEYPRAKKVVLP